MAASAETDRSSKSRSTARRRTEQPWPASALSANGIPDVGYQPQSLVEGNDGDIYFTNSVGVYKLDSSGVCE